MRHNALEYSSIAHRQGKRFEATLLVEGLKASEVVTMDHRIIYEHDHEDFRLNPAKRQNYTRDLVNRVGRAKTRKDK